MSRERENALAIEVMEMINNPEFSDIILVCEDGVQVHASRMLLAARSCYFRQKLLSGTPKFKEVYTMHMIKSTVMIIIMRFLYTGVSIDDHIFEKEFLVGGSFSSTDNKDRAKISSTNKREYLNLDWDLLLKLADAARIFELDHLKRGILTRLRADLPGGRCHTEDMQNRIACTLSAVCEYNKVWTDGIEGMFTDKACLYMVKRLRSHDLSPATLFHLSKEAFHYYLAETLSPAEEITCEWSLDEYLRVRQILTWCVVQAGSGVVATESLDRTCLPGPETAFAFLEACEGSRQGCRKFDFSRGRTSLMKRLSHKVLKPLLDLVDLACVHPELLLRVIEPLRIVEPLELTMVLGVQAMKGSKGLRKNAKHHVANVWQLVNTMGELWRKPTMERVTLAVTMRRDLKQVRVKAIAGVHMQSSGDCEWEIVVIPHGSVVQKDMAGFEVGFYRLQPGEAFDGNPDLSTSLTDDPRGSAMKICGDLRSAEFGHKQSKILWKLEQGTQFTWNSPIRVKLNRTARTCTFSYVGNDITLRMKGVKEGLLFPAIDFTLTGPGHHLLTPHYDYLTVNIKTLRGFNLAAVYVDPEILANDGV